MNILALFLGFMTAIILIGYCHLSQLERHKPVFSVLLFSFPLYYFAFAIYAQDDTALILEVVFGAVFLLMAIAVIPLNDILKYRLLGVGYILHAGYDLVHDQIFINLGTPNWWPEFCGLIDILLGIYLLNLAHRLNKK